MILERDEEGEVETTPGESQYHKQQQQQRDMENRGPNVNNQQQQQQQQQQKEFRDPETEIEDKILRRQNMAHLFQWYYPEGGWGIIILITAMLTTILSQGFQLCIGFPIAPAIRQKFPSEQVSTTKICKYTQ